MLIFWFWNHLVFHIYVLVKIWICDFIHSSWKQVNVYCNLPLFIIGRPISLLWSYAALNYFSKSFLLEMKIIWRGMYDFHIAGSWAVVVYDRLPRVKLPQYTVRTSTKLPISTPASKGLPTHRQRTVRISSHRCPLACLEERRTFISHDFFIHNLFM